MNTPLRIVAQCLLFVTTASFVAAGDPVWKRKSSTTGEIPVPNRGKQQTCCVVADLDGDGIQDFVVGKRTQTPSIVWYKYDGKKWNKRVIDDTHLRPEAGGDCFDVDGDGDQDVVFGQDASGADMWSWENPCPNFSRPWQRRLIKHGGPRKHHDQTAGDFDGDGKGQFRKTVVLYGQGIHEGRLADLDGDGDLDILIATRFYPRTERRRMCSDRPGNFHVFVSGSPRLSVAT